MGSHSVILDRLTAAGLSPLEVYEELYALLPSLVPPGHRLITCGLCRRSGIMPEGPELRRLRESRGFTRPQVAERAGCSVPHLCFIEKGQRNPTEPIVAAYQSLPEEGPT